MKPMRLIGLLSIGLFCCGAGHSDAEKVLKQAQFASIADSQKYAERALALDPSCGDAYALRGFVKYSKNDFPGAIKDCTKALELHPKGTYYLRTALNYRYHSYIELKDWKNALTDCLACLKVEHTSGVAHDASVLCEKVGDPSGSKKYSELAWQYKNESRNRVTEVLSRAQAAHDPARVDDLLKQINDELKQHPGDSASLSVRASCYRTKGRYEEARQDLSKLIAADPSHWVNYLRRSEIYQKMGDKQKSADDLKKAKQLGYDPAKLRNFFQSHRAANSPTKGQPRDDGPVD